MKMIKDYSIERYTDASRKAIDDSVIIEYPLDLYVNEDKVNTLYISPKDIKYLTIGYLYTNGYISHISDIIKINLQEDRGKIFVEIKNSKYDFKLNNKGNSLKVEEIYKIVAEFENKSDTFKKTGAAHSVALAHNNEILNFQEDVSRSNAVDKVIGYILYNKIDVSDKYLLLSCRISELIMEKIIAINIKTVISISPPTSLAIDMAKTNGINLIGFARNKRFNLYNKNDLELI